MQDAELLHAYITEHSQEAFAELVRRHIGVVYSAARRQTRDADGADDVTQAVFIVLAQKARKIDRGVPLAAWLLKTTHFASMDFRKRRERRLRHEQAAAALAGMKEQAMNHDAIREELDAALASLSDMDRGAVTLRYLSGMSLAETAAALRVTPAAGAKRVARALNRLRRKLLRRGVNVPAAALGPALLHLPGFTPGAHLADAITAATALPQVGLPATIAAAVVHMMVWAKLKVAASLLGAAALAAAGATGTIAMLQRPSAAKAQSAAPVLLATANPNEIPAPAPAAAQPASSFGATLANGVSFEVIGVNESPSNGKPWWKPDGSALSQRPYSGFHGSIESSGALTREVAVRIKSKPNNRQADAAVRWDVPGNHGRLTPVLENPLMEGIEASALSLDDNHEGATVHAQIAAGKWTTVCTAGATGDMSTAKSLLFGSELFVFGGAVEQQGWTHIQVGYSGLNNLDLRLAAVDTKGHEIAVGFSGGASSGGSMTIAAFTVPLPIKSIKEWDLQTRPFDQWIEVRHVSLHRDQSTTVEVVSSDKAG